MSAKIQSIYICSNCDAQFPKWTGRCLECGAWGSLTEQLIDKSEAPKQIAQAAPAEIIDLGSLKSKRLERIKTGICEVDRVLGNGLVPGSLVLLSGEPGIGKSTILAQIANAVEAGHYQDNKGVVYASGEESAGQVKDRLERLGCGAGSIKFISETNVEKICAAAIKDKPLLLIIDSIQTVYSPLIPSESGSINQIRAGTVKFLELAKEHNIVVILVGHITKDGQIAGPKSLEHIVDTVLYLESESSHNYRVLRAAKNRFGSVNELGIFEMTGSGFKEIKNPSAVFVDNQSQKISGSVISCVIEGTRPFLVEIQALVSKTIFGYPQRKSSGFDLNRLQVLAAVLTKRANINLINQDIILNMVGGLRINDPALDLAVCLSIASSLLSQTIDPKTIVFGEVGLGGEVRNVSRLPDRLKEAERLGFKQAIISDCAVSARKIKLNKIKNLENIARRVF